MLSCHFSRNQKALQHRSAVPGEGDRPVPGQKQSLKSSKEIPKVQVMSFIFSRCFQAVFLFSQPCFGKGNYPKWQIFLEGLHTPGHLQKIWRERWTERKTQRREVCFLDHQASDPFRLLLMGCHFQNKHVKFWGLLQCLPVTRNVHPETPIPVRHVVNGSIKRDIPWWKASLDEKWPQKSPEATRFFVWVPLVSTSQVCRVQSVKLRVQVILAFLQCLL